MKKFIFALLIVLSFPVIASAHPGRTAYDGCHYCQTNCGYWGVPWYARHCHARKEIDKLQHYLRQEDMNKILAWDGYDWEAGSFVEIEDGNLVREGEEIEYYDYGTGEYKNVEVESIESTGGSVEIEVYDYESGEYKTLEMDD